MKYQGKFSLKYMSNPINNRTRNHNKENRNTNGTFEECSIDLQSITPDKLVQHSKPQRIKEIREDNNKLKEENEKYKHEIKLMREQIRKLKQKNHEQVQTICQYEAYIQEVKQEGEMVIHERDRYQDHLKYSIFWFVEAFSLFNTKKLKQLDEKFINYFQYLKPIVKELEIEKQLKKIYEKNEEEYLQMEESQHLPEPQLHSLLDTFNIREEEEENDTQQCDKIARKLFTASQNHSYRSSFDRNRPQENEEDWKNRQIMVKSSHKEENDDYLNVSAGETVKLLRKIGSNLWIAESGNSIGYINKQILDI